MSEIELIGAPRSVFVRATRLAFEEKQISYRVTSAVPHMREVSAINPFGKIPVMRHGDFALFESLAIIFYVDRSFAGPKLIPDDPQRAARILQWVSAVCSSVFPATVGYMQANAFPAGPNGTRDASAIERFLPGVAAQIDILDRAVADTGCLACETFTPADMYLLPILDYLRTFPESAEMLANARALTGYFETHAARASFRNTIPG
jgi:glutathione S-transferase